MGNAFGLYEIKDAPVRVRWVVTIPKVRAKVKLTPPQFDDIIRGFESVTYYRNAPKTQITHKMHIDIQFHKGYEVLSGPIDDDDDTRGDYTTAPSTTTRDDDDDDAREVYFEDGVGFAYLATLLTVDKKRCKFYWIRSWIAVTDYTVFVSPQKIVVKAITAEQAAAAIADDRAAIAS